MTAAAERALRTLGDKLGEAAEGMPAGKAMDVGREIMLALAAAHIETADALRDEREAAERKLNENPTGFRYDPKGGKSAGR